MASLGHLEFSARLDFFLRATALFTHLVQQALSGVASSDPSMTAKHIRLCLVPSQPPLTIRIVSSLTQNAVVQKGAQGAELPETLQSTGFWSLLIYFTFASVFLRVKRFLFTNKFFVSSYIQFDISLNTILETAGRSNSSLFVCTGVTHAGIACIFNIFSVSGQLLEKFSTL